MRLGKMHPFDERLTMSTTNSDARINFRLNSELKKTIEDAAAELGSLLAISLFQRLFKLHAKC
jgi:hypothetical protein